MPDLLPLPEPAVEYRLAAAILGKGDLLDRAILEALVSGPRRYGDFKPLLEGRNDNVLTKALARLRRQGVIKQGVDLSGKGTVKTYALTRLGVLVVFRLHEMVPVAESIRAWQLGHAGHDPRHDPVTA